MATCGKKLGDCIAFGKETKAVDIFFDFASFEYLDTNKKIKIINQGVNGMIYMMNYIRENYKAKCIMKRIKEPIKNKEGEIISYSDNLFYEGVVGQHYINQLIVFFLAL